MDANYKNVLDMSVREWLKYYQTHIVFGNRIHYKGIRIQKSPLDLWVYQEIIYEIKPDVIIEIGSFYGGSTLYLSDLVPGGLVISVDINRTPYELKAKSNIAEVTGNSSDLKIFEQVKAFINPNDKVLIIQDGGHTQEQVYKDLKCYADLVTLGSYFIVEDAIVDYFGTGEGMIGQGYKGPGYATDQFLLEDNRFAIDRDKEKFLITYNPNGFLKRVK